MINQTALFFAAARAHGEDSEAMELCQLLLDAGVPLHHKDAARPMALQPISCMLCRFLGYF